MDISIFTDKSIIPNKESLEVSIGTTYHLWNNIVEYVHQKYPIALDEWSYPGAKYGWSFKIKDKKRAIIYLLPRDKYFKIALVFGQKATDIIMESNVSKDIKTELQAAKVYAEGRGVRIDVNNESIIKDVFVLIDAKMAINDLKELI